MRQRRTTPGRSVGKCISPMTVAPDRESCSISRCGVERTSANEMPGAIPATEPVVLYWPVRPPHHASPSALTLNTPKSPKPPSTSRTSFARQRNANFMPSTQKVTNATGYPPKSALRRSAQTFSGTSIFRESGTRRPSKKSTTECADQCPINDAPENLHAGRTRSPRGVVTPSQLTWTGWRKRQSWSLRGALATKQSSLSSLHTGLLRGACHRAAHSRNSAMSHSGTQLRIFKLARDNFSPAIFRERLSTVPLSIGRCDAAIRCTRQIRRRSFA